MCTKPNFATSLFHGFMQDVAFRKRDWKCECLEGGPDQQFCWNNNNNNNNNTQLVMCHMSVNAYSYIYEKTESQRKRLRLNPGNVKLAKFCFLKQVEWRFKGRMIWTHSPGLKIESIHFDRVVYNSLLACWIFALCWADFSHFHR